MPIRYKINILKELEDRGYNAYKLRRDKKLSQATIESLRDNKYVSFEILGRICELLEMQPADIIEFVPDDKNEIPDLDPAFLQDEETLKRYEEWCAKHGK